MPQSFIKDPSAVLDYVIDWSDWLAGDTISTSTWIATGDISVDSDDHTDTATTVWLSGGTAGEDYKVTNTITTVGGRTDQRTIYVLVRER